MKDKGRVVYLSAKAMKGLQKFGRRYIIKDFDKSDHVSYNKAVLLILKFIKMSENIQGIQGQKNKKNCDVVEDY